MSKLTMVEAVNLALSQEMERDENVCMLGEDIGVNGGVFRATKDLQKEHGEERVMDTPLAECGIVGTA
ncbi:MAG: alpha-ketoacid dehydrogenase subunit beta, partial [Planctomycetes bacterium]|nr:alpha-ketoacid dehydrogenase subunit beta [Planctomycetota bacterium]